MSQFQSQPNPNYPMTNYYPAAPGNTPYPPSSQYPPQSLPGNNPAFAVGYSSLSQNAYPPQQQQIQYPNPAFNAGYPSSAYPGGQPSSGGVPRNASDPRNWAPF
ncbi:hypothetical protein C8R45DRAFT_1114228 [Mycena sanguinolenta]|nr:hypothetical protein C8R45DRAFT_1114228 [Mycena sanguinolenta]